MCTFNTYYANIIIGGDYIMTISEKIKQLRKDRKLTQTQLADQLDKSLRTIQKYESGEIIPNIDVINLLAKIFNVSIQDLFDIQPEDTYIKASNDSITINQYIHFNSELVMEIIHGLYHDNDIDYFRFIDDDIDLLTEDIKKHIIFFSCSYNIDEKSSYF